MNTRLWVDGVEITSMLASVALGGITATPPTSPADLSARLDRLLDPEPRPRLRLVRDDPSDN